MINAKAYKNAYKIIEILKVMGYDYSGKVEEIAKVWDQGIWKGCADSRTLFEDGKRDIRVIKEDHQINDNEAPNSEDFIAECDGFVYFAD